MRHSADFKPQRLNPFLRAFARRREALRALALAVAAAMLATACDVGPKYHKPTAAVAP